MTDQPRPDSAPPNDDGAAREARSSRWSKVKGLIAGAVGAAAIGTAGVVGISMAHAATPTPTPTPSASASTTPDSGTDDGDGHGRHHGFGGGPGHFGFGGGGLVGLREQGLTDLATELGVTESKLTTAMKTARESLRPAAGGSMAKPTPGERPDASVIQQKFAAALAKELGISEAKVTAALEKLKAAAVASREAAFSDRLDQAVTDGKLTRAEADAVLKAAKAGVIDMGPRGMRGPR